MEETELGNTKKYKHTINAQYTYLKRGYSLKGAYLVKPEDIICACSRGLQPYCEQLQNSSEENTFLSAAAGRLIGRNMFRYGDRMFCPPCYDQVSQY